MGWRGGSPTSTDVDRLRPDEVAAVALRLISERDPDLDQRMHPSERVVRICLQHGVFLAPNDARAIADPIGAEGTMDVDCVLETARRRAEWRDENPEIHTARAMRRSVARAARMVAGRTLRTVDTGSKHPHLAERLHCGCRARSPTPTPTSIPCGRCAATPIRASRPGSPAARWTRTAKPLPTGP
jgi:hypothetical protein